MENTAIVPIQGQSLSISRDFMLKEIECLIVSLLRGFVSNGSAEICMTNSVNWLNYYVGDDQMLRLQTRRNADTGSEIILRKINYSRRNSKRRFAVFLYVLAEVHKNLVYGIRSTTRALYYDNILLTRSQTNVNAALRDVCTLLQKPNWQLGVLASGKGLVAGALNFIMTNGDIIDCRAFTVPTLIPTDISNIEFMETNAKFVLLVEKDTIFEKLITDVKFPYIADSIILITGKGYPDISTRVLVNRLHYEHSLPIYALVDADPFGIEILLVYRHGSRAMAHSAHELACPQVQWIGIHPSEMYMMSMQTEMLGRNDHKKIIDLLKREYIDPCMRNELQVLQQLQRKAEIENFAGFSLSFLLEDYIPNKINRNLVL